MPDPFSEPPTPETHFALAFYGAVLDLLAQAAEAWGSLEAAEAQLPFLAPYAAELSAFGWDGLPPGQAAAAWWRALAGWEGRASARLPLAAVAEAAGLGRQALALLLSAGLPEEDARFGLVFEALQGLAGQRRPSFGLLAARQGGAARRELLRLLDLGLLRAANSDAPRSEWALAPAPLLWDALRGAPPAGLAPWLEHRPPDALPDLGELVLPPPVERRLAGLLPLLAAGEAGAVVVRGPRHNGRRTLLGALARALGRGLLLVDGGSDLAERLRLAGPLASALGAMPALALDLPPGATLDLAAPPAYGGPLGLALGPRGGLGGPVAERALTVELPLPTLALRRRLWAAELGSAAPALDALAAGFRMSSGNIGRAARLARACAALAGRPEVGVAEAREAAAALSRQALETLAQPLPAAGDLSLLAVGPETRRDLELLAARCRQRERLAEAAGPLAAGAGVRALLNGPSGTGKTLAARLLAAELGLELYRIDLAAVVDKYIGETEKRLDRVLALAEELDVLLLLDEGDALLTRRTAVHSANDRYANLETNFLLQRLESFAGVLLVATNAAGRIDDAFQRRMDVVVEFRAPDPSERWSIWQSHLPAEHSVGAALLEEVARRCDLSGGQIRNAALHATLLALDEGAQLGGAHLEAAVRREYRKLGGVCPLRQGRG